MLHSPYEKDSELFGQELTLNLYNCDLKTISSRTAIRKFVIELCDDVIHMKRYGKAFIPHFGHENPITSGYSLVQLIETSSVTAHFSEYKKSVYMNIFSCAWFDAEETKKYVKKYFGAKTVKARLIKRP
jgi:S-adenosylmethionine decarboxylase